ncbi:hypothetical protein [Sorangium sp. So ce233]|uniref:hypothetical protein n=1 Tax=Sorangium sp. So ce233 TaxID=3133290 RepID=UPI003F5F0142
MSEQFYAAAIVIGGVCLLAVLITAMLAVCLGRGLRAHGVARIGEHSELRVRVEVPAVASLSRRAPSSSADAKAGPSGVSKARRTSSDQERPIPSSPGASPARRARIAGGAPARVLAGTDAEAEAEDPRC